MGFFNLLSTISHLKAQGGMKVKYQKLIKNLESLSHEDSWSHDDDKMIKINHEMQSELTAWHIYKVDIFFMREGEISVARDLFKLTDKKDKLQIDYFRQSKSFLPFLPNILPEKIEEKFFFDSNTNQDIIFEEVLEEIVSMYREKYNFSEEHYERVINNL